MALNCSGEASVIRRLGYLGWDRAANPEKNLLRIFECTLAEMASEQTEVVIARMEKIELADFYAGMMFLGVLAIFLSPVSYFSDLWLRSVDPDAVVVRDHGYLIWMLSIGLILGMMFGLLFRRSHARRTELIGISKEVSSEELLVLAVDQRSAGWVAWLLRHRLKATQSGMRAAVAATHYAKGSLQVYEQLKEDEAVFLKLEGLCRRARETEKSRPLSPLWRGLYLIPIFTLLSFGWFAQRPEFFKEPYSYGLMIFGLVGFYFPLVLVSIVSRKRGIDLAAEWDKALHRVRLDNLVLLAGARVMRSKIELARRVKEKVPGAKEGMREVERFTAGNRFVRF